MPSRSADRAGASVPYVPALDGLRAVAILLVIVAHMGLDRAVPGGFGVTLFFFVSGLLITRQLLAERAATGRIDLPRFYLRRVLRLLPAALAFILIAGLMFRAAGGRITPAGWAAAVLYGANGYDLFVRYASTIPGVRHPFNILWSLAVEEHFYVLWPLALVLLPPRRGAHIGVLLAVIAACLAWRAALVPLCAGHHAVCGVNPERIYKGTDTRLDSIAWGALAACAPASWRRRCAAPWAQAAALVALVSTFLIRDAAFRDTLRYSMQGAALAVLVPALLDRPDAPRRALESAPAVLIGRLSYSLYLWHWAALGLADRLAPAHGVRWLAIGAGATAALSAASYAGIERPMLRLRRRAGSSAPLHLRPDHPPPAPPRPAPGAQPAG